MAMQWRRRTDRSAVWKHARSRSFRKPVTTCTLPFSAEDATGPVLSLPASFCSLYLPNAKVDRQGVRMRPHRGGSFHIARPRLLAHPTCHRPCNRIQSAPILIQHLTLSAVQQELPETVGLAAMHRAWLQFYLLLDRPALGIRLAAKHNEHMMKACAISKSSTAKQVANHRGGDSTLCHSSAKQR
jgi:hypothetical protein